MGQRMSDTVATILRTEIETPADYKFVYTSTLTNPDSHTHCFHVRYIGGATKADREETIMWLYVEENRIVADETEFLYSDPQVFNAVQLLIMAKCMDDRHTRRLINLRVWLYAALILWIVAGAAIMAALGR